MCAYVVAWMHAVEGQWNERGPLCRLNLVFNSNSYLRQQHVHERVLPGRLWGWEAGRRGPHRAGRRRGHAGGGSRPLCLVWARGQAWPGHHFDFHRRVASWLLALRLPLLEFTGPSFPEMQLQHRSIGLHHHHMGGSFMCRWGPLMCRWGPLRCRMGLGGAWRRDQAVGEGPLGHGAPWSQELRSARARKLVAAGLQQQRGS